MKDQGTWKSYDDYCKYSRRITEAMGVAAAIENIRELKRIDDALLEFGRFLNIYCDGAARRNSLACEPPC